MANIKQASVRQDRTDLKPNYKLIPIFWFSSLMHIWTATAAINFPSRIAHWHRWISFHAFSITREQILISQLEFTVDLLSVRLLLWLVKSLGVAVSKLTAQHDNQYSNVILKTLSNANLQLARYIKKVKHTKHNFLDEALMKDHIPHELRLAFGPWQP